MRNLFLFLFNFNILFIPLVLFSSSSFSFDHYCEARATGGVQSLYLSSDDILTEVDSVGAMPWCYCSSHS
jgi:hypothetical protein